MIEGIYTLANDVVYDQLVALLNSIEVNVSPDFPVGVIAYDEQLDKVRTEIRRRKNVELIENSNLFLPWEKFSEQVWSAHPYALKVWRESGINGVYRLACNHRYFAFDSRSDFDKFIYFDADVLVFNSLDFIFDKLETEEVVVYDFQYKDPSHIYNLESPKLLDIFPESRLRSEIFCSGCFASKPGIFSQERRDWLIAQLNSGEAEILYLGAPNQSVLNYLVMRSGISVYNFSLNLPENQRTGCCVTSSHFQKKDHILYDKGNRLTYLHYIGLSSQLFTKVCAGENIDFPYRDLFLHYRYLHEPEKRPQFTGKPQKYNQPPGIKQQILKKLSLINKRFKQ